VTTLEYGSHGLRIDWRSGVLDIVPSRGGSALERTVKMVTMRVARRGPPERQLLQPGNGVGEAVRLLRGVVVEKSQITIEGGRQPHGDPAGAV
jgi:hypothetical protein